MFIVNMHNNYFYCRKYELYNNPCVHISITYVIVILENQKEHMFIQQYTQIYIIINF